MKEIENPSIPSHPLLHHSFETRGKEFLSDRIGTRSLFGKMVQGLAAFKDLARTKKSSIRSEGRCWGYSATVLHHHRSSILSDLEREKEREPCPELPRVSLVHRDRVRGREQEIPSPFRMHRDLTRCAPPDPYLRRGLPRALLSTTRFSSDLSTSPSPPPFGVTVFSKREVETLGERRR